MRTPFTPTFRGSTTLFGDSANFNYVSYGPYGYFGGGVYGNYLTNGEGTTDENGQVVIPLPADLLTEADAGSRRVNVEATVSDLAEFPVTSKTSVVFHGADTYVGIRPADYSVPVGQEAAVDLITVDWDGEPVPDQTVAVTFYQREWESERTTQDGQYYTEWTPVDTEIAHDSVTTDDQGKASASFMPEAGGAYIAVATVTDAGGRSLTSSTGIYVMDENYTGWRSAPREYTMELIPDQQSYQVGDTARILVQSPFPNPVTAWLAIERGNLVDQKLVQVSSSDVLEIPITADMAPNVYLSLAAVKPVEPDNEERPFADIRFGITELQVDPDRLALNLTITPKKQSMNREKRPFSIFKSQIIAAHPPRQNSRWRSSIWRYSPSKTTMPPTSSTTSTRRKRSTAKPVPVCSFPAKVWILKSRLISLVGVAAAAARIASLPWANCRVMKTKRAKISPIRRTGKPKSSLMLLATPPLR
ncbi:MAG: hypothetical protein M5U34_40520 [Chloroflexi bacterium]|nr:hypothetical protein [Chloroflexota bacterium]